MTVDVYTVGGCTTCSSSGAIVPYMRQLAEQYGLTLVEHNVQIYQERQNAEACRNDFPEGHFYFPLTVIDGVGKVCGYKPLEIEEAVKESLNV